MMANAKAKGFSDLSMEKRGIKLNGTVKIPSCLLPLLLMVFAKTPTGNEGDIVGFG